MLASNNHSTEERKKFRGWWEPSARLVTNEKLSQIFDLSFHKMSDDGGIYPVDSGVIRCICGFDHDDGFTIQCEKCNAWQHAICVDIYDDESVPEVYLCNLCGDRKVDPEAATERQLANLKKRKRVVRRSSDMDGTNAKPGPAIVPPEGKKRGRKKRQPEAEEAVPDSPLSYYVRTSANTITEQASEYLESLPVSDAVTYLSAAEYSRAKPASVTIQRFDKGFGVNMYGLITNMNLSRDRFVIEFCGEVLTLDEYKKNPINQYRLLGCPKPGVVFIPQLSLAVDGRCVGSDAVFIRRSSTPNLRFSPVVVENKLHIVAFASQPIKSGTELTASWDWDAEHPIQKLRHVDLNDLDEQDQECLGATAAALRNIGFTFRSLSDCLSPDDFVQPVIADSIRARPIKKAPTPAELLQADFLETSQSEENSKVNLEEVSSVPRRNIWFEAPTAGTPEKIKKKLSLADYKKKHA